MPTLRVSLRTKLLTAFAVVLAPVLVLLLLSFRESLRMQEQRALEAQLLTAQAVGVQVDEAFEAALGMGWAVAENPLTRSLDPAVLDPYLRAVLEKAPRYDALNVFDREGLNRGWGQLTEPATPRLEIPDRPYFQQAMSTNAPAMSDVIVLRRPQQLGFVVSVPIRDDHGLPIGVVNVVARTDMLAEGYSAARFHADQSILLIDRVGKLAFITQLPQLSSDRSELFRDFDFVQTALGGKPTLVPEYASPVDGQLRMGAFVPTSRGWVVGVTIPIESALGPAKSVFRGELLAWSGLLVFSMGLALFLVRYLSQPVLRLADHARALGEGALERRVDIRTGDELQRLGEAFNDMAARLAQRDAELARAHEKLVRRERLAAVGELAAVIAHEVRNPLGVIFNAVAALRRAPKSSSDVAPLHDMLQEEADRLNRIVGDLLDFARPLRPALEPENPAEVLRESTRVALTDAPTVRVHEEIASDLGPLPMDGRMMRQALINLAANAVQAMPRGGELTVRAVREARGGCDGVRFDVQDEGPGIDPVLQERIFEPFFTTKAMGTGLGLAVVKRIIEEHQGQIMLHSPPGRGTTFTVWLPYPREPLTRATRAGG